jgi:transcriptional regulator with XRE-family HTH domain
MTTQEEFILKKDTLGERIRSLRHQRRWSQQELSMRASISTPHISSIELDKRSPSLEYANRLANALGVTVQALCDEVKIVNAPKMKNSTEEWPLSLQNFILNESAAPYLEAAQRLSQLPSSDASLLSLMIDLLSQNRKFEPNTESNT